MCGSASCLYHTQGCTATQYRFLPTSKGTFKFTFLPRLCVEEASRLLDLPTEVQTSITTNKIISASEAAPEMLNGSKPPI